MVSESKYRSRERGPESDCHDNKGGKQYGLVRKKNGDRLVVGLKSDVRTLSTWILLCATSCSMWSLQNPKGMLDTMHGYLVCERCLHGRYVVNPIGTMLHCLSQELSAIHGHRTSA